MLFSLFLAGFVAAIYAAVDFGYIVYASSKIKTLDNQIAQLSQEINPEARGQFIDFYSQIAGIQKLIGSHVKTSRFFSLLESTTNSRVRYTNLTLNFERNQLSINGAAATYENLAQQLQAFSLNPNILSAELRDSGRDENGVLSFFIVLTFNPSLFL